MSTENNEKIVEDHRKMVALSGNLSDFQLKNLKEWPFVVFDDLENVRIQYNFKKEGEELVNAGHVTFDFKFKKVPDNEDAKKRLNHLKFWTQYMFWNDTEVSFLLEGEKWAI